MSSPRALDGDFVVFRHGETAVHFLSPASPAAVAPPVSVLLDAVGQNAALTARSPV